MDPKILNRRSLRRPAQFIVSIVILSFVLAACSGGVGGITPTSVPPGATALPTQPISPSTSTEPTQLALGTQEQAAANLTPVTATQIPPTGPLVQPSVLPSSAPTQAATDAATQAAPANATVLPDPNAYQWKQVASGLRQPIGMTNAGDGSGRLFIVEKGGRILILANGQVQAQPFLDISDRVGSRGSEQGLLGLAFDPKYQQNGRFFVDYTDVNGNTVVSRFTVSSGDANRADPGAEKVLLTQKQPFPNHNGGQLAFGPDGYLYIGLGDGGSAGDPHGNGQNLNTFLGKILRIDVSGDAYAIPKDNPFVNSQYKQEIWAYGLRNPWRFSFDRANGDLYIADVGQDTWEEIDYQKAGAQGGTDYGWNIMEGSHPYKGQPPANVSLTPPVFDYSHQEGGCSVTGGYVYRGSSLPEWQGIYLFGDYCSGKIWGLLRSGDQWTAQVLFDTNFAIPSFGQDESGEVYVLDINGGVYQLAKK